MLLAALLYDSEHIVLAILRIEHSAGYVDVGGMYFNPYIRFRAGHHEFDACSVCFHLRFSILQLVVISCCGQPKYSLCLVVITAQVSSRSIVLKAIASSCAILLASDCAFMRRLALNVMAAAGVMLNLRDLIQLYQAGVLPHKRLNTY